MRLGVIFPQTEIGSDPGAIRGFVQAVEEMGFDHLTVYDHVLGADTAVRPNWTGFYNIDDLFHELFVLFGFLGAITSRIELMSGVLVLGQRPTALVAKQAAEVDVLTGGRLRLGVGTGWNDVEYEALGANFHDRGARSEEQIELMRALWTQKSVTFEGRWHKITAAGINPMPIQRPIPIWIGGHADVVLRRIGRIGDGWLPGAMDPAKEGTKEILNRIRSYVREAGRDTASVGIEGGVALQTASPELCAERTGLWRGLGCSHVSVNTMGCGYRSVDEHLAALGSYWEALGRTG